jgi:hypothetical protein
MSEESVAQTGTGVSNLLGLLAFVMESKGEAMFNNFEEGPDLWI